VIALSAQQAIEHLARGGLVAYPTETSWGLGADARSEVAIERLHAWKGRDPAKPISVLVSEVGDLAGLGAFVSGPARRLAEAFWPGPLTLVLHTSTKLAEGVAGPGGAVGLRCSPHPAATALAKLAREHGIGPLTATSLNRSGEPDCTTRATAERLVADAFPLVEGPDAGGEPPSTVVDATGGSPRVLREGAISERTLLAALETSPA
jgi:tRNA threonylcarbamoyl adenosine modification protein (Sua5/YciO/YrdC/YwlC family)